MSSSKIDALNRLDSLIKSAIPEDISYGTTQWHAHFIGWRAQAISALESIIGRNEIYTTEFKEHVIFESDDLEPGLQILQRLHFDIENGYREPTGF